MFEYDNITIMDWSEAEWSLIEDLLRVQRQANALDGYHARQSGTYGAVKEGLVTAITCAIITNQMCGSSYARSIADRLYDEAIDNGENIRYQVQLWNDGVIGL